MRTMLLNDSDVTMHEGLLNADLRVPRTLSVRNESNRPDLCPLSLGCVIAGSANDDLVVDLKLELADDDQCPGARLGSLS